MKQWLFAKRTTIIEETSQEISLSVNFINYKLIYYGYVMKHLEDF